jgi:Recombination endonuclease VII
MSTWKGARTPEQRARAAALQRARRAQFTPEQRAADLEKRRAGGRQRYANATAEARTAAARRQQEMRRRRKETWPESDLEALRARDRAYRQARLDVLTPEELEAELRRKRDRERDRRASWTPEERASRWLRSSAAQLGFDPGVIEAHFMAHSGRCDICGRTAAEAGVSGKSNRLAIDHDHKTGTFRGLLCHHCNFAIGLMGDRPDRLIAAADYLINNAAPAIRALACLDNSAVAL